jgi:hypothetical protein
MIVTGSKSFVVPTDIGFVQTTVQSVEEFDIEDLVRSRAESQAAAIEFQHQANETDIDAPSLERQVASAYSQIAES